MSTGKRTFWLVETTEKNLLTQIQKGTQQTAVVKAKRHKKIFHMQNRDSVHIQNLN